MTRYNIVTVTSDCIKLDARSLPLQSQSLTIGEREILNLTLQSMDVWILSAQIDMGLWPDILMYID